MEERSPGELKRDIVAALGLMVLALAYGLKALTIPGSSLTGKGLGANAVPTGLAIAMGLFSLMLLVRSSRALRRAARTETTAAPVPFAERLRPHRRALGMLVIGIAFVSLLEFTGYGLAVGLLLAATAWYNGQSKLKPLLLFAAGGAVVYDILFVHVLGVTLPAGIWPSLFPSLFGVE